MPSAVRKTSINKKIKSGNVRIFASIEYYDAIWVIPSFAMSVYFMFLYFFFADCEFYFEKTKAMSIAAMAGAVVNIILNYIFIKMVGYVAAGYTTLFCYILYAVIYYMFLLKICRENFPNEKVFDLKVTISISLTFMIIVFLITATYSIPIIRYLIIAVIIVCIVAFRKRIFNFIKDIWKER